MLIFEEEVETANDIDGNNNNVMATPKIVMATSIMVMGTTTMVMAMSRVGFLAKVVPCWAPD